MWAGDRGGGGRWKDSRSGVKLEQTRIPQGPGHGGEGEQGGFCFSWVHRERHPEVSGCHPQSLLALSSSCYVSCGQKLH